MCLEMIEDTIDTSSNKVEFMPCDDTAPSQMWKFDQDPAFNQNYQWGGLVYNMAGGCLAVVGPVQEGKNLKVVNCGRNNAQQHWLSDGDSLLPRDTRSLCVASEVYPIGERGAVVLKECDDMADSLDYN